MGDRGRRPRRAATAPGLPSYRRRLRGPSTPSVGSLFNLEAPGPPPVVASFNPHWPVLNLPVARFDSIRAAQLGVKACRQRPHSESRMSTRADDYRQRALAADRRAAQTSDPHIRGAYEQITRDWLALAEQVEWSVLALASACQRSPARQADRGHTSDGDARDRSVPLQSARRQSQYRSVRWSLLGLP